VRRIARNQVWLVARHFPPGLLWPILVAQLLWGAVALRHGRGLAWVRGKWQGLAGFRKARAKSAHLDSAFLVESERQILRIQKATGFDTYWRLYFFLSRGGAK